jgi:hypothetical protein
VALLSLYRALIGREQQAPPLLGRDRDSYAGNKNRRRDILHLKWNVNKELYMRKVRRARLFQNKRGIGQIWLSSCTCPTAARSPSIYIYLRHRPACIYIYIMGLSSAPSTRCDERDQIFSQSIATATSVQVNSRRAAPTS